MGGGRGRCLHLFLCACLCVSVHLRACHCVSIHLYQPLTLTRRHVGPRTPLPTPRLTFDQHATRRQRSDPNPRRLTSSFDRACLFHADGRHAAPPPPLCAAHPLLRPRCARYRNLSQCEQHSRPLEQHRGATRLREPACARWRRSLAGRLPEPQPSTTAAVAALLRPSRLAQFQPAHTRPCQQKIPDPHPDPDPDSFPHPDQHSNPQSLPTPLECRRIRAPLTYFAA